MISKLVTKLSRFVVLTDEERQALSAFSEDTQELPKGAHLLRQGEKPGKMPILVEGWACRYKLLENGKRQIFSYLVPGDLCDMYLFIMGTSDYSTVTLSPATIATISEGDLAKLFENHPRIERAMMRAAMVDEAILREWLISAAQRNAEQSMAHLFCELWVRLRTVGRTQDHSFEFMVTQAELADTLGLTSVHVNRVLKGLRQQGVISLSHKQLTIHQPEQLASLAGFDADYLHLEDAHSRRTRLADSALAQ